MPLAPSHRALWIRGAITYAVYLAAGALSLLVATEEHHVAQLYMAAGFGLALVLGWGRIMAVAVGLGSASVTLLAALWLDPTELTAASLAMMGVSGIGGGLQAWLTARYLQGPEDRRPLALDTLGEVVRFLLVAGPLACTVNATLTVSAAVLVGKVPPGMWLPTLSSWWAGDALGVLMGTPMMLTLVGQPARLWRQRRLVVGMPLLVATLLLGLGIRQVQIWESQRESAEFRQQTEATANGVRLRLNGYLAAVEAIRSVYDASDSVERDEFRRATAHWVATMQGILAIGWEERLRSDRLAEFEAEQRAEGLVSYQAYDLPGHTRPKGPDILAVRFVEPLQGHEHLLGFNALSRDVSRVAYQRAVRENAPVVTPGFLLTEDTAQQLGVVIYRAVYRTPPQGGPILESTSMGTIFLALHMDDAMAAIVKDMPGYMGACLVDVSTMPPIYLSGDTSCKKGEGPQARFSTTVPLPFAGRTWALRLWSVNPVPLPGGVYTSWLFAVGGVAFAATLGALLLVITGATEHMAAAVDEAREQRAAAERANQAKSEFLSRMSHELRTPLNAILGFAQVMSIDSLNPLNHTQQNRIDQVQQAGWHLLDMIDDVLDLSRIDSGTLSLRAERLALPVVLEASSSLVVAMAQRQQVRLEIDAKLPPGWGVQADETRLRQVLTNLLTNAVKYNQPGGSVRVKAALLANDSPQPMVQLDVTDTGLGMNPEQLSQLFQPFNRLGRERLSPDGTGIGLVISRHLVQLMGGGLEVVSEEGVGSTFTMTLPAAALHPGLPHVPVKPMADLAPAPRHDQAVRHVLYVEDNDANTAVVQAALLGRAWLRLNVAATIEEGLAALHDRLRGPLPDLILLDVHLPDASGLDFLKLVKANPETALIPVIMISADAMPEQIDACLKAGAACYLTKPLQIGALLQQTDDLLNAVPPKA